MNNVKKSKKRARETNKFLDFLMKSIEKSKDYSFQWLVGGETGEMSVYDNLHKTEYIIKIERAEYDENGNLNN